MSNLEAVQTVACDLPSPMAHLVTDPIVTAGRYLVTLRVSGSCVITPLLASLMDLHTNQLVLCDEIFSLLVMLGSMCFYHYLYCVMVYPLIAALIQSVEQSL